MEKLTIVKVGGKVVETPETLEKLLNDFSALEGHKILIHGGGRSATAIAARLGIESKMVDGRRITDAETLEVVTMVYGGLVNKRIVAGLQARKQNAIGLTGADFDVIRAVKRPVKEVDYGFVGDVTMVNEQRIATLLSDAGVPVMAPLTHDGEGNLLNTNADTIASTVACEMAKLYEVNLIYCFEKSGVLRDENDDDSVIPVISSNDFDQLVNDGIVSGGMIPKLQNGFHAIAQGVHSVTITNASSLGDTDKGTKFIS